MELIEEMAEKVWKAEVVAEETSVSIVGVVMARKEVEEVEDGKEEAERVGET